MSSDESKEEQLDRELIELLNELRVALPGVQVIFAFLLTVPFSQRFEAISDLRRDAYFATFVCAATSSVLLIAPSAQHRILWRQHDKKKLLERANVMALAGLAFLALAISGATFMITDLVFGAAEASAVTAAVAGAIALFWWVLPLWRRVHK